jgi:hypothetical protein
MRARPKIKIRKCRGAWFVFIPGDMPEMPRFREFHQALDAALYAFYRNKVEN